MILAFILGGLFSTAYAVETYRLTVDATPSDSRVRIMNIKPKYRPGIVLTPGKYDIYVTRNGFKSKRGWVEIKDSNIIVEVMLNKRTVQTSVVPQKAQDNTQSTTDPPPSSQKKPGITSAPKTPQKVTSSPNKNRVKTGEIVENESHLWQFAIFILLLLALGLAVLKRNVIKAMWLNRKSVFAQTQAQTEDSKAQTEDTKAQKTKVQQEILAKFSTLFSRLAQTKAGIYVHERVAVLSPIKAAGLLNNLSDDDERKETLASKFLSKSQDFQVKLLTELDKLGSKTLTDGTLDGFFNQESFTEVVLSTPAKAAQFLNNVLKRIGGEKAIGLISRQPDDFQAETLTELEKLNSTLFVDGTLDCLFEQDIFTDIVLSSPPTAATFLNALLKRVHCEKAVGLLQRQPKDFQIATLAELEKLNSNFFTDGTLDCIFGEDIFVKAVLSTPPKAAQFFNEILKRKFAKKVGCQELSSLLQSTAKDFQENTLKELEKTNPKIFTNGTLDCLFSENLFAKVVLSTPFKAALFLNEVLERIDGKEVANLLKSKDKEFQILTLQELEALNSRLFIDGKLDGIFYDEELLTKIVLSNAFTAAYFLNRVILKGKKEILEQIIGKLKSKTPLFKEDVLLKLDKLLNLEFSSALSKKNKCHETFLRWDDFQNRSYKIVEIIFSGDYHYDCESAYEYVSMSTSITAACFLSETLSREKVVDGEESLSENCPICYGNGVIGSEPQTSPCTSCDGTGKEKIVYPKYRDEYAENSLIEGANKLKQKPEGFQKDILKELTKINPELAEGLKKFI